MNILIDTQVFVWLVNSDSHLGPKSLELLIDKSNNVSVSYFSFFEMTIKASIGKLQYDPTIINDLPKMGIELIMADTSVLQDYAILNQANKDPFDNIIISVARNERSTLMTSDPKILSVVAPHLKLIDATR
ncbi:MAG TPA: type II toxin-antitoxin system VapC family toxin [Candidatus Saccharimonadales bacterium]|nr:type II toxin-antitoxin system VapC family toxin [Candidatus Saccharimonadales bacterium]